MVVKIYALMWLLIMTSAGVLYFTSNMTELAQTIFGFVVAMMFSTGFVGVLPWWVDRKFTWRYQPAGH